ncbi:MAG: M20/M25/M40 family metallo-hydrolase, partial [Chloroflexota bacterium]|nr:M20/M25/M40 family metallo-hydrolase [Chloroflexota bacterium]
MSTTARPIEIDFERLLDTFVALLSVDSYYGDEERVVAVIKPRMEGLGIAWRSDPHGNLIGEWPARGRDGEPIILNAHMDTVRPTPEMTPVVKDDGVYSDGSSVLGADDKAGVAAIMEAVQAYHESGEPHGPVELLFTTGED